MVKEVFIELVENYKSKIPITDILRLFNISKSTYYRWKQSKPLNDSPSENELLVINKCKDTNFEYGYQNIKGLLANDGHKLNKNTVQRIMQKYKLHCKAKPKRLIHFKGKESKVAHNILDRDFKAMRPLEKLVTDVTYLPWGEKTLYLSSIMDLYNGEIIAFTLADKQDVDFVLDTLNQLPKLSNSCILHSDQGSVYTSRSYQTAVQRKSITMSMSRKGTPSDNACIESFHASLKSEMFYLDRLNNEPTSIVIQTVIDYINYYNKIRIQQKLGYKSPIEYRKSIA